MLLKDRLAEHQCWPPLAGLPIPEGKRHPHLGKALKWRHGTREQAAISKLAKRLLISLAVPLGEVGLHSLQIQQIQQIQRNNSSHMHRPILQLPSELITLL